MSIDDELRQALLLSLQEDAAPPAADVPMEQASRRSNPLHLPLPLLPEPQQLLLQVLVLGASAFVERMLGSLVGVDVNDPRIREALQQLHGGQGEGPSGAEGGDKKDDSDKKQ
ncbi:unnamed protein product [Vitrella brassicaformis CCMP3155]|uniref:Uncharacterized protein n=1 Tax=Vitrella brassicaformis (strain CCMP3155) TaxID=1169540 RepID=A0A0G4EIS9_VITBC|nr:unnamed protein product [Vitrella brassicaformis CCMP3155]|eukprot:CEL96920.1 unnamed protein product [Vitrella brassicaformis CCMP3155]